MFRIFTDLCADLPTELVDRYDLGMIPMICSVDGEAWDMSEGFDGKSFYDVLRAGAVTRTMMPTMNLMLERFTQVLKQDLDLLYIAVSSGLSGTASLAKSVAEILRGESPARKIMGIDTPAAALGEGSCVLHAAELREEGCSFDDVVQQTEEYCDHMWQLFTVEDLDHLQRGGRFRAATVRVGQFLNVRPILMVDDRGRIVLRQMNVGRRRCLDTMATRYKEECSDRSKPVGLSHSDCAEDVDYMIKKLRDAGCTGEIYTVMYEPITGSHVGPGSVALFFYGAHR